MKNPETLLLKYAHILSCCALGRYISLSDFVACIGSDLICVCDDFNIGYKTDTTYTVAAPKNGVHIYSAPNALSVRIKQGILTHKEAFMYLDQYGSGYNYYWFDLAVKYKKPLYDLLTGIVKGSESIIHLPMPIFTSRYGRSGRRY